MIGPDVTTSGPFFIDAASVAAVFEGPAGRAVFKIPRQTRGVAQE